MLNKRPFVGVVGFYIIGVLAVYSGWNLLFISAVAVGVIVLLFCVKQGSFVVCLMCVGSLIVSIILTNMVVDRYEGIEFDDKQKYGVVGRVIDQRQNDEYQLLTLRVENVNEVEVGFKMQLYVFQYKTVFEYGDRVYATTRLQEPQRARYRGDFDVRNYAMSLGLRYIENASGSAVDLVERDEGFSIGKVFFNVRKFFWSTARELLSREEAALSQGLMLGDTLSFTDEMKSDFRASGVSHITALSGTNVSIISVIIFFLLARATKRRWMVNILAGIGIIGFYFIVGYSASVLRAVIMALVAVVGNVIWRRSEIFNALAISLFLILAYNPFALFDVGLQLSFLAVLGIALFAKPFAGDSRLFKNVFVMLLVPTIFSLLTTGIVTANSFNQVNFTAIWTNIIVIPISTVALVGSYIMCIVHAILPPVGVVVSCFVYLVIWVMKKIIDLSADYAIMNLTVSAPSVWQVGVYCAFLYFLYAIEVKIVEVWSRKHS